MKVDGRPNKSERRKARLIFVRRYSQLFAMLQEWSIKPEWEFFGREKTWNPETIFLVNRIAELARKQFVYSDTTYDRDIAWNLWCLWRTHVRDNPEPVSPFDTYFEIW